MSDMSQPLGVSGPLNAMEGYPLGVSGPLNAMEGYPLGVSGPVDAPKFSGVDWLIILPVFGLILIKQVL